MEFRTQPSYYVVFVEIGFKNFAEAMSKAPADIAAHVARTQELYSNGELFMSGAFLDSPEGHVSTMAVLPSREAADRYIHGDPFYKNGMIKSWHVREWANIMAGRETKK